MNRKNNLPSFAFLFLGAAIFSALGFGIGRNSGEITPLSIDGAADLIGLSNYPTRKGQHDWHLDQPSNQF
jgi:hypothetical protein